MSHLIKNYAVCKFSCFHVWYLKSKVKLDIKGVCMLIVYLQAWIRGLSKTPSRVSCPGGGDCSATVDDLGTF